MDTKTGRLTKEHNSYPWKFQQMLGDLHTNNYINMVYMYEEFQHLVVNFNFGIPVRGISDI
jgi:hypothetical protein